MNGCDILRGRFQGSIFKVGTGLFLTNDSGQTWEPLDFPGDFHSIPNPAELDAVRNKSLNPSFLLTGWNPHEMGISPRKALQSRQPFANRFIGGTPAFQSMPSFR